MWGTDILGLRPVFFPKLAVRAKTIRETSSLLLLTSATAANPYIDFDMAPGDIAKLQDSGVRPKDAVDAGFTRVTSSEAAFYLNRTDTGDLEGIMVPYRLLGAGISHCRVILDTPVRLKTSKGKLVPALQPVASTNWLYYVPGTTPAVLADSSVPVLLFDSECSALAGVYKIRLAS